MIGAVYDFAAGVLGVSDNDFKARADAAFARGDYAEGARLVGLMSKAPRVRTASSTGTAGKKGAAPARFEVEGEDTVPKQKPSGFGIGVKVVAGLGLVAGGLYAASRIFGRRR